MKKRIFLEPEVLNHIIKEAIKQNIVTSSDNILNLCAYSGHIDSHQAILTRNVIRYAIANESFPHN